MPFNIVATTCFIASAIVINLSNLKSFIYKVSHIHTNHEPKRSVHTVTIEISPHKIYNFLDFLIFNINAESDLLNPVNNQCIKIVILFLEVNLILKQFGTNTKYLTLKLSLLPLP